MYIYFINPLNAELNPICHLLALLGAHHILRVSRIRVKSAHTCPRHTSNATTSQKKDYKLYANISHTVLAVLYIRTEAGVNAAIKLRVPSNAGNFLTSFQQTLLHYKRVWYSVIPNVWRRAPVILLLSTDAPPFPVCGAGVYTVSWMWTTLFYYLFELRFSAKWALQRSIWRWAWRMMWNVHNLEDSIDDLFHGAIPALTLSVRITISVSLTKLSDAVRLLTCIQEMSRLKLSQDTA